jgi:predicted AAA+ superfamily ATPase
VARTTVDKYFQILEETLIGERLPAWHEGIKAKEVTHPKFYVFDAGVARACAGIIDEEVDSIWKGYALETLIFNELKSYNFYKNKHKSFYFYQISGSYDIDFIIETKKKTLSAPAHAILISVKYSKNWDKRWNTPLLDFKENAKTQVTNQIGIYQGTQILTQGPVTIYPVTVFLRHLWEGQIYG